MEGQKMTSEIRRPLANFRPDLWGDHFLNYIPLDKDTQRKMEENSKELKELVRKKLLDIVKDPKERLEFLDAILRLGVAYHFENEIEENLLNFHKKMYSDDCYEDDLYYVSLRFRLLRQHGIYESSDVFEKFKGENGSFKDSLAGDVQGILSLYEASYLRVHGESLLDEALEFSTTCLNSISTHLSSHMAEEITHSLELPLHRRSIRLESRYQISFYESKSSHDKTLLRFAKLDFNLLQELHKMELRDYTRWSRNFDSIIKLPKFMRDRVVEGYYWDLAAYYEPGFSYGRMCANKLFKIISTIDDIYDAYGTIEELESFTKAMERWDKSCINELPDYVKLFYQATLDTFEEIEQEFAKVGRSYAVYYARQRLIETCRAYLEEAKWCSRKIIPTYEDYIKNGVFSSGYLFIIVSCLIGMGEIATKDVLEWNNGNSKAPRAACIITRLLDDIADHKVEQEREHVASSVECYIKQYGSSEEEAYKYIQMRMEEAWMDVNQELLESKVPKSVLTRVVNLTRVMYDYMQIGKDGYTEPEFFKPKIIAVLVDPIKI